MEIFTGDFIPEDFWIGRSYNVHMYVYVYEFTCQKHHNVTSMGSNEGRKINNKRWKMKDKRWKMKDERWKMKDERWKMKDERWKMKDEKETRKMKDERWQIN